MARAFTATTCAARSRRRRRSVSNRMVRRGDHSGQETAVYSIGRNRVAVTREQEVRSAHRGRFQAFP